jgi:uncharacterized OsmC-like protein
MNAEMLRAQQAPLKEKYKADPATALRTLVGKADLALGISVLAHTAGGMVKAGLHPATGGDGTEACSADMLLQSLAACAGITLKAVATAIGVEIRSGAVLAEGLLDFRGTLGVSREAPVGFKEIKVTFELDSDAPQDKLDSLLKLAERYCVVFQTLKTAPVMSATLVRK